MALFLPQRWKQQPQYRVGVDRANPLTAGIELSLLPSPGFFDVVTGRQWSSWGTAPTISPGRHGLSIDTTAAFGGLYINTAASIATAAQTHAILVDFRESGSASPTFGGLMALALQDGSANSLSVQSDTSVVAVWSGATPYDSALSCLAPFGPSMLIMTGDASGSALYRDGQLIASGGSGPVTRADSMFVLHGERGKSTSYAIKAKTYFQASWTRRLTAAEIAELSRNPWQLYSPIRRRIYFGVSAGGAYTLPVTGGTASVTGGTIAPLMGRKVSVTGGTASVTGGAISALLGRKITVAGGSVSVTGGTITLTYAAASTYRLTATGGTAAVTGGTIALRKSWGLSLTPATIAVTGASVTLRYGGASIWTPVSGQSTTWTPRTGASTTWTLQ